MNAPPDTPGMSLDQLIAMLMAARAQGATHVQLAQRGEDDYGNYATSSGVDWVSMAPVGQVVYVGSMPEWTNMANDAAQSLDW